MLPIFFYSDQPATCPHCGSRTHILLDFSHTRRQVQVHRCRDKACQFEFVLESDERDAKGDSSVSVLFL